MIEVCGQKVTAVRTVRDMKRLPGKVLSFHTGMAIQTLGNRQAAQLYRLQTSQPDRATEMT